MLDDFFTRALVGGIGVALVAGPLGCFIVWRRMAYFGDTMAHAALLGVALALLLEINITLGVFVIAAAVAFALLLLRRPRALPTDALPRILSHSPLPLALLLLAFLPSVRLALPRSLFVDPSP